MDVKRFITREDFLKIKPLEEGGTVIGGRRYVCPRFGSFNPKEQLNRIGEPDAIGEGKVDSVFFFEVCLDPEGYFDIVSASNTNEIETSILLNMVSAKIVDRYEFVSAQEAQKEVALIRAKIALRERKKNEQ